MFTVKQIMDKNARLRLSLTEYETYCIRLYTKVILNWTWEAKNKKRQQEVKQFCKAFTKADLYEIVEAYFKIMRKYGEKTYEEPYYWLSPKQRREIKYEGEMLKRSTMFDDNEIRVSILEELV